MSSIAEAWGNFPVLYDTQIAANDSGANFQPGAVYVHRSGTGRANWALVKYVKLDNNGCSQGEVLSVDDGQSVEYGVKKAGTSLGRSPHFRGIAAATITSNYYGFMIYSGYCETADLSHTAASGEMLCISGSTAGKLTPDGASSVLNATLGTSVFVTIPHVVAVARTAIATGTGSVQIIGIWG